MNNNVIGPITQAEWRTLLQLKQAIRYMKETDCVKYSKAIEKDRLIYRDILADAKKVA